MLFGNREELAFEIHPLAPTWERRYPPETSAWARFGLWVAGANLCHHALEGSDSVRDSLNIPLAPLVNWIVSVWPYIAFEERAAAFATSEDLFGSLERWGDSSPALGVREDDWIDLREQWWSHHFAAAGAEGSILPSVAFVRQHDKLIVQWRERRNAVAPRRWLHAAGQTALAWDRAAEPVGAFVAHIAEWLRSEGHEDLYPWVRSEEPLASSRPSIIAALELFTARAEHELAALADGHDAIPEALGLPVGSSDPAASPVTQALRDLPGGLDRETGDLLRELDAQTRRPASTQVLATLRALGVDATGGADTPEAAGYQAAAAFRRELGLNGQPIENTRDLLTRVGCLAEFDDVRIRSVQMISGLRREGTGVVRLLRSERTEVEWGQRFETIRALGHFVLDSWRGDAVGAASSPFAQGYRRRRSGAFAAEFLLPEAALRAETGGVLDAGAAPKAFKALMERFGVGASTTAYQLWNRGFLSSPEFRDQLIEEFGHPGAPATA